MVITLEQTVKAEINVRIALAMNNMAIAINKVAEALLQDEAVIAMNAAAAEKKKSSQSA